MWHRRSQNLNPSTDFIALKNAPPSPLKPPRSFSRPFRSSTIWNTTPLHSTLGIFVGCEPEDSMGESLLGNAEDEYEYAESIKEAITSSSDNGSPGAYTFFNFDSDDEVNEEDEEEEETPYKSHDPHYSFEYHRDRISGNGTSSSDDSSTLASQRSYRSFTQSSSSSISGRHQHPKKAARVLGLDQHSLRSFGTFPSYSTDNLSFGFTQKNVTTTDLLKPSDAALASYLIMVGWDNKILKDTDTINDDVSTATLDAAWIWNALNGEQTPDIILLNSRIVEISSELNRMVRMRERYLELYDVDVLAEVQARTHGFHRTSILCLIEGPHETDARLFDRNDLGFLRDEKLMAEALFAKEPNEIHSLIAHFFRIHGYSLRSAIEGIFEPPATRIFSADSTVHAGRSGAFGRACIRALSADREVETPETVDSMTPTEMLIREHQLADDVEQLYRMDLVLRCRVLDHHLLLELVMTRSDIYLEELCRLFSKQYGMKLTDTLLAMGWTAQGTLDVFPPCMIYVISYTLDGTSSRTIQEAQLIDEAMSESDNHERLVTRIIGAYFRRTLGEVKNIYETKFLRKMEDDVLEWMPGACGDLLIRLVESCTTGEQV